MNASLPAPSLPQAPLTPAEARWRCPLELIPAETSEGVDPIEGIIGQDRAIKALKLGVEMMSPGYNVFVCGLSGTGKVTTIKTILEKIHPVSPPPDDLCYIHDFKNEDRPRLLRFPRGRGREFRDAMASAVRMIRERISSIFEEEEFNNRKKSLIEEYSNRSGEVFTTLNDSMQKDGFIIGRIQDGQAVHPEVFVMMEGKPLPINEVLANVEKGTMTEEDADALVERYKRHRDELMNAMKQSVQIQVDYERSMTEFETNAASLVVSAVFSQLFSQFDAAVVADHLQSVSENILANIAIFKGAQEGQEAPPDVNSITEYKVNLVLDNTDTPDVPVILESFPTFVNLFGTIDRRQDAEGMWYSDFTLIKPGAILRADGGYLVLNAADALSEPGVWKYLQRVLLHRKLEIQSVESLTQQAAVALKPEAIDVNIKVILVGNNEIYSYLATYERDFKKIFKVKADFDYEMHNTDLAVKEYSCLVRKLITEEGLRHFDNKAIAGIVEYGARLAGSRKKLTTQFSEIADIVREANYWCMQNSNKYVTAAHVEKAIDQSRSRHGLYEDKLEEMIENEIHLIDVDGSRVGQINGLTVYTGERYSFGRPARITVAVGVGEDGIINIEREANLSGSTHDKGVLIFSGFFREMFAQTFPVSFSASISFEQSYGGIDGDSASSTELYALLSALAGIPIQQRWAVTGSVNQKGDVQPIGGVNEKIEGYFDVCRKRGLTGRQGVIIPIQNVDDLMLDQRVVEAMEDGRFAIHPISRIEQGIELLMGAAAGERTPDGHFTPDSVFDRVGKRLAAYHESLKRAKRHDA